MRTALFLKTYLGDSEWLPYCLRSIQKFCSGYEAVVVASEAEEQRSVVENFGFRFVKVAKPDYSGYLQQQVEKMHADIHVGREMTHVVYTDCDSIFDTPNTPETWCVGGKPRLVYNTFEHLRQHRIWVPWQGPTQRILHFKCPYETMRCQPLIYATETVRQCREYCESKNRCKLVDWVRRLEHPWGTFSEFNIVGNYAMRFNRNMYHCINFDAGYFKVPQARQFGFRLAEGNRVNDKRKRELEEILS